MNYNGINVKKTHNTHNKSNTVRSETLTLFVYHSSSLRCDYVNIIVDLIITSTVFLFLLPLLLLFTLL